MTPSTRRLQKEATELATKHADPAIHASPVDDNLYEWHFTILGPPSPSVYNGGIYHGRISLPASYPLKPPSFRFLTPSGRFEVNREICLSISGHHEESWAPAWGIRSALVAVRSFMDGESAGQIGGLEGTEEGRREFARLSRGWKCAGCAGGRTNEEVMRDWGEECAARGVKMGGEGETATSMEEGKEESVQEDADTPVANTAFPAPVPVPAPLQPPTETAPAPVHIQPRQTQSTPADGPWLDRAIIGVVCALAFMILRRILQTEE